MIDVTRHRDRIAREDDPIGVPVLELPLDRDVAGEELRVDGLVVVGRREHVARRPGAEPILEVDRLEVADRRRQVLVDAHRRGRA